LSDRVDGMKSSWVGGFAVLSVSAVGALYGCGGGSKPADTAHSTSGTAASAMPSSAASAATAAAGSAPSAAPASSMSHHEHAEAAPHEDPNEKDHVKDGPIEMAPLIAKNPPKSLFPKATIGDHECLAGFAFTGNHKTDYETLVKQCGTPTGLLKYAEPKEGRLHAKHDKRDVFSVEVRKGMCYRYFAVADNGIADIDILIEKKNGALIGEDKTTAHRRHQHGRALVRDRL
jgi:hypothetical protein